ncbi:MAG: hypothetical protein WDZ59_16460 [Pirellulales bacterium]
MLLLLLLLVYTPGCGGCRSSSTAQQKQAEKDKEKARREREKEAPFEVEPAAVQPVDGQGPSLVIKPGHWTSAVKQIKSNDGDFVGTLKAAVTDRQGRPSALAHTPYLLTTTRPAVLPKGEPKLIESLFFVPPQQSAVRFSNALQSRSGAEVWRGAADLFSPMPPYQYHFVVLSRQPNQYGYLKVLDSVRAPWREAFGTARDVLYYRVVAPAVETEVLLPDDPLAWTSVAYLLWDDVDPEALSEPQQTALVDWLHWGGQIIIDGPDSLDSLRGSFLAAYLPAESSGTRQYDNDFLEVLNSTWTVPTQTTPTESTPGRPLVAVTPWSGIDLQLREGGRFVPTTGELLADRRVGRGRVAVSAVRLTERDLLNWPGYDGLVNACLLGRPPRKYFERSGVILTWADQPERRFDPQRISNLRYFARDTGRTFPNEPRTGAFDRDELGMVVTAEPAFPLELSGGVAAWDNLGAVADGARSALREAAGITIPRADFVVVALAVYLVVLVPANWLVFRALGRVEWAWAAAPIIALASGFAVVKMAQVDIGFVRADTQVGVLEVYGGHPRGHLTRYTALYSSLSTDYELTFDKPGAVALPLPIDSQYEILTGQTRRLATYSRYQDTRLSGIRVSSNSTGMLHSEQMVKLSGALALSGGESGPLQVTNSTALNLVEVGVVRKRQGASGNVRFEKCWIGSMAAGATVPLVFTSAERDEPAFADQRTQSGQSPGSEEAPRLDLAPLYALAEKPNFLEQGEVRLTGRIEVRLPGQTIEPDASQKTSATLVVAHLDFGRLPTPRPDVNTRAAVAEAFKSFEDLTPLPEEVPLGDAPDPEAAARP